MYPPILRYPVFWTPSIGGTIYKIWNNRALSKKREKILDKSHTITTSFFIPLILIVIGSFAISGAVQKPSGGSVIHCASRTVCRLSSSLRDIARAIINGWVMKRKPLSGMDCGKHLMLYWHANRKTLKNCWPCSKEADGRLKGENESVWKEKDKSGSNDWIRWERTIRKRHFER